MVKIKQQLVSSTVIRKRSSGYGNPKKYITVHQTGNTSRGANAQAHANIQTNLNPRNASWQYSVDDKEAIQSFPDEVKCWAASDGSGPGNTQSIHVEICINSDGDYVQAVKNGASLVHHLMKKHNISIERVKQHNFWYPKNCPAQIRAGKEEIDWNDFLRMAENPYPIVKQIPGDFTNKQIRIIYKGEDGVNFRTKPDWDMEPAGFYTEGKKRDIIAKYSVDGNEMFQVLGSDGKPYYVTAWHEYVEVIEKEVYIVAKSTPAIEYVDVEKGAYYEEAVMKLKAAGIMEGVGNDKFGVGQNIKREDFAVALVRALKL